MRQKENENNSVLLSHCVADSVTEVNGASVSAPALSTTVTVRRTPPISLLISIQKTVQHFASLLANVLHLEVEVVDHHLLRIAGTGPYGQNFGQIPESNTLLLKEVLEKKQEIVIFNSRQNILCQDCQQRESCRERGFIGVPIIYQQHCLGVISLVAINLEQLRHLREHTRMFIEYIRHISTLLADNLSVLPKKEARLDPLLQCLCESLDQGVIICDRQQRIIMINPIARKLLPEGENYIQQTASIQPIPVAAGQPQKYQLMIGELHWQVAGKLSETTSGKLLLLARGQSASQRRDAKTPLIKSLIGESVAMKNLQRLISRIASSPSSVMIMGESGTGKEVVARAIHHLSSRHAHPFVAINCAAIPESLLESELFGYVKGAFTGAAPGGKRGLIQMATGGTLFLDEIGDMPLGLQARLLRAIENREVMPIGASQPLPVDIRILSATHQNLEEHIREGRFREDLYYRLNVIPVWLPALREREGDVELLLNHFLSWHARRIGRHWSGVSKEVLHLLRCHRWPGNVRELSNLVEYLINIVPEGELIDSSLLPPVFHSPYAGNAMSNSMSAGSSTGVISKASQPQAAAENSDTSLSNLKSVEKTLIEEALQRTHNKKLVADELGIGVATLYRKIKKYGLS